MDKQRSSRSECNQHIVWVDSEHLQRPIHTVSEFLRYTETKHSTGTLATKVSDAQALLAVILTVALATLILQGVETSRDRLCPETQRCRSFTNKNEIEKRQP